MDFEKQAPSYDHRVGLPPSVAEEIARTVIRLPKDLPLINLLEIGAGTGEIGCEIIPLVNTYTAIDNSPGMLQQFRQRCQEKKVSGTIIQADGNLSWPVQPGAINLIFSSRALHLLNFEHVTKEINRLSQNTDLWLLIGKVKKAPDSVPAIMRRTMRQFLKNQGIEGLSGKKHKEQLVQYFVEKGATSWQNIKVASWQKNYAPIQSINAWRNKSGLAGTNISPELKTLVLDQVEAWAGTYFEDIQKALPVEYTYELKAIKVSHSVI